MVTLKRGVTMQARLEELRRKLAARTTGEGKPATGFKANVAAIKAEVARLEADLAKE